MRRAIVIAAALLCAAPAAAETYEVRFAMPRYRMTDREADAVATCLVLEAASQGDAGLRGVMSVIRNRARGRPEMFAAVVLAPRQFSSLNQVTAGRQPMSAALRKAWSDRTWAAALAIAREAEGVAWLDRTGGATHYTRVGERTPWTTRLTRTAVIGDHAFYR